MNGLFYKELRQNRLYLILIPVIAFAVTFIYYPMGLLMGINGEATSVKELTEQLSGHGETPLGMPMILLMYVLVFFIVGIVQSTLFQPDEAKKWGYFTASHPKGIKGALYAKYLIVFLVSLLTMVSLTFADELFALVDHLVLGTKREEMVLYATIFQLFLYIQLFLRAIDIPFTVRFGTKLGGSVKVGMVLAVWLGGGIYFMFGPLPESPEIVFEKIYDFVTNLQTGEAADWLYLVLGIFLCLSAAAYVLSYFISCKLYLKGVEQYDK